MPRDKKGKVHRDEFKYNPKQRISLYRDVARLLRKQVQHDAKAVFQYSLRSGISSEILLKYADHLESIMEKK